MALFAIVMAFLLEQVRPLAPDSQAAMGLHRWVRAIGRNVDAGGAQHGGLAWALAVVLPTLAAVAGYWLLGWLAGWPLQLALSVFVLYLTLGFRQFSQHFSGIREALETGDEERACVLLARWRQVDAVAQPRSEIVRHVIEYSVLSAHRQVFGVLLWFCLLAVLGLGPAGAVLYSNAAFALRYWHRRLQAAGHPVSPALVQVTERAWYALDWLPAHCTALGFAVVGSFEDAVDVWRNHAARFANTNDGALLAATAGALGVRLGGAALDLPGKPPGAEHLTQVVGMLWRTVALWLLLLVLLTLARVMG
ncbi:MAG: cobalamin biosynthesis protein [Burkholderiaceae bacterium]|jgi:adenosylcobinamide-phosphate synthase|nr:cobalamin biosynthesis protein [Burkholderiaceae bacterium]